MPASLAAALAPEQHAQAAAAHQHPPAAVSCQTDFHFFLPALAFLAASSAAFSAATCAALWASASACRNTRGAISGEVNLAQRLVPGVHAPSSSCHTMQTRGKHDSMKVLHTLPATSNIILSPCTSSSLVGAIPAALGRSSCKPPFEQCLLHYNLVPARNEQLAGRPSWGPLHRPVCAPVPPFQPPLLQVLPRV